MLQRGAAWIDRQRKAYASTEVTYCRGSASVVLAASAGTSTLEQVDHTGARVKVKSQDWLITTADLVLEGERITPKVGDKIRIAQAGQVLVYEVLPPQGQPAFRPSDAFGVTLRVHTKLVATETP